jgi:hypothetical protein
METMLRTGKGSVDRVISSRHSEVSVEEIPPALMSKSQSRLVRSPKRRRVDRHHESIEDFTEDSADDSSWEPLKSPHRATMSLHESKKNPNSFSRHTPQLQLTTGRTSQHFSSNTASINSNQAGVGGDSHEDSEPIETDRDGQRSTMPNGKREAPSSRLSNRFHRAGHDSLLGSEDELQHSTQFEKSTSIANDIGQRRTISERVDEFMWNPKQRKGPDHTLSEGTIIPTTFTSSKSQQVSRQPKPRNRELDSFRVRRIRNQNFESDGYEDVDIILKYYEDQKAFIPTGLPQDILNLYPYLTILHQKINKIKYGADSPSLIQLEFMRSMGNSGTQDLKVDLEMEEDRIGSKFLEAIQRSSGPLKLESLPTYVMLPI